MSPAGARRLGFLFLAYGLSPVACFAAGTTAAEFLRLGTGARAAAMGDAQAAAADDATAIFGNPAALTVIPSFSMTAFHAPYIEQAANGAAAYAHNLGRAGAVGAGLRYASAGSSERRDEAGLTVGSLSPSDRSLSAGYAWRFRRGNRLRFLNGFSIGGAVKHVSSRIVEGAEAVTLDAGLLSPEFFNHRLRAGVTASNIGGRLRYGGVEEPLPSEMRLGTAYRISEGWRLAADVGFPKGDPAEASLGAEYSRPVGPFTASVRAGHNTRWAGERDGLSGTSAGFGVTAGAVSVDYFVRFLGNGWLTQGASLSWGFGTRHGVPEHVWVMLEEARRLAAQNRFAEAVLRFNDSLVEEPSCREAMKGLEEAARNLR